MRKLRVGIVDLVAKGPTNALYARVMNANLASIMPQVVGVWCEARGHEVTYVCYTGLENLTDELPHDVDIVFICSFTEAAFLAYALSAQFRSKGAVTALGGPHARCYPEDARKYFDYVVGLTDRALIREVLRDCSAHRPVGGKHDRGAAAVAGGAGGAGGKCLGVRHQTAPGRLRYDHADLISDPRFRGAATCCGIHRYWPAPSSG